MKIIYETQMIGNQNAQLAQEELTKTISAWQNSNYEVNIHMSANNGMIFFLVEKYREVEKK